VAIYKFASGTLAVLVNSSVTLAGENTTEIYGDQGVIIQNHDDLPSTNVAPPPGAIALKMFSRGGSQWQDFGLPIPKSHGERIAGVPRSFIDCLKNDTAPAVTALDGRVSVEMVLGAYQSALEGRRIAFPLVER
jgi:predicted dehydrogenase